MISVEKFDKGALRVSYDDGRDDWLFWPFDNNGGAAYAATVGDNRVLAVHSYAPENILVALWDADSHTRLAKREVKKSKAVIPSGGEYIVFTGYSLEKQIVVISGHDLSDLLRFEDERLDAENILYHRHDDSIVLGTPRGPGQVTWEISFDGGEANINTLEGKAAPQGFNDSKNIADPVGRRVVTVGAERAPVERENGKTLYGVPLSIWNLQTLEVENTVIVDRLSLDHAWNYQGQDRQRANDPDRVKWEEYIEQLDLAGWDGDLDILRPVKELRDARESDPSYMRRDLISGFVRSLAWEPDGEAFWVLFCSGFLRRVDVGGSISRRYVVQRIATPPALGKKRWKSNDFFDRQLGYELHCLPDCSLRIVSHYEARDWASNMAKMFEKFSKGGELNFNPAHFRRPAGFLRRLQGMSAEDVYVSIWGDGFFPDAAKKLSKHKILTPGGRENKAVAARMKKFLARTAESVESGEAEKIQRRNDEETARKAARPAGSIDVEKFGYICGGALRVEYVGRGEDWMFLPFRHEKLQEFHVLGDDRILAYASRELALFDVGSKTRLARQQVGGNLKLHASANGEWVALVGKVDGEKESLTIYGGHDLREIYRMEEEGLSYIRPVYERDEGALLVGSVTQGPVFMVFVVTFEDGTARAERREGARLPGSYDNSWPCPSRRRVLVRASEQIPVREEAGGKSFGLPMDVWNLNTLEIERTIVLDQLPVSLEDAKARGLEDWDGSLKVDPSMDDDAKNRISELRPKWETFSKQKLCALAWEADGEAFWGAFAGGYVRRATVDGSVSPRVIPGRLWPSEDDNGSTDIREMAVLPDGRVKVEFYTRAGGTTRYFVCFRPPSAADLADGSAPDIRIPDSEDGLGEVYVGYPTGDEALKARMKDFEEQAEQVPITLASLSAPDCISVIEELTEAIARDPYELICGSSFRPTFVFAEGTRKERRMAEDEFFAHVAAKAPEARDAIDRLLHIWMDKVPLKAKHRNYYMNDQTVALSHALKALVTLDPTCYGTIRRYITELDLEHDVFVKMEVVPCFGKINGWRDMDAIKLGIFIMLEEWCAGSGGSWLDPTMQGKIEAWMGGRKFAEFFIHEVERYFSPDEASFNREAWNHNSVLSYLQDCEMMNFRRPDGFDREVMAVIDEYIKPKPD